MSESGGYTLDLYCDFSKSNSRQIENQYDTMTLKEIKGLKIPISENAVLYLWATAPKLIEALEVVEAWGFTYKTHAVWDKEIIGMGYWFRGQHELLLVGVKGKMSPPLPSLRKSSVLRVKRGQHSRKPDHIRNWIQEWYPNEMKIELFVREKTLEWDIWGNEVESDVELRGENGQGLYVL